VKQRRPKVILELGGGYSTLVIARAVSELGQDTTFWSVDLSDYWQEVVKKQLPPSLASFVRFHYGGTKIKRIVNGKEMGVSESLPVSSANLVYVDGGDRGDALMLEQNAPKDFAILVDGRGKTVESLKRELKENYQVGPGPYGVQTLFTRMR
jgi:hypothetical protein